jgi:uncharacterized membrane protein
MDRALFVLVCAGAIGSAIVGGMFYAFSSFVMPALARIPPEQGVAAMRSINLVVITPSFMLAFAGTAVLCVVVAAGAYAWWHHLGGQLVVAAAMLYVAGCFVLTMALNQPMNLRLGAMPTAQALEYWPEYVRAWTRWNHVRTAASLAGAALFIAALMIAMRNTA